MLDYEAHLTLFSAPPLPPPLSETRYEHNIKRVVQTAIHRKKVLPKSGTTNEQ